MKPPVVPSPPLSLEARVGQPLALALPALRSAGQVWQAPPLPPGCTLREPPGPPPAAQTGGVVDQCFELCFSDPGECALTFTLRRPWRPEVLALQPVRVRVTR